MYAYPVQRPPRTPDGLKWILVAFVIYMATLGVQLVQSVLVANALGALTGGAPPEQTMGTVLGFAALGLLIFALFLVTLVFYFIGFGYLYGGRDEFASPHPRNMQVSLYSMIAAIVIAPVGVIVQFILLFSAIFSGFVGPPVNPAAVIGAIYTAIIVGIGFSVAAALFAAVTLVLSVRALSRPEHRYFLYTAGALGPITPAVVGALTLWQISGLFGNLGGAAPTFDFGLGIPALLASGLGLVTFALYLVVYRDARERMRVGELKPIVPPPVPMTWMPMPVVPYPAAPPPPYQPPGSQGPPP